MYKKTTLSERHVCLRHLECERVTFFVLFFFFFSLSLSLHMKHMEVKRFYHMTATAGHAILPRFAEAADSALSVTRYFFVTLAALIPTPPNHNLQSIFRSAGLHKMHILGQIYPVIPPYCLLFFPLDDGPKDSDGTASVLCMRKYDAYLNRNQYAYKTNSSASAGHCSITEFINAEC